MRSLSFTRSSPAPVTVISPPNVASAASPGSSSIRPGTSDGAMTSGRRPAWRTVSGPTGSSPSSLVTSASHVGARAREDVEQRGSRRIQARRRRCGSRTRAGRQPRRTRTRPTTGRPARSTRPARRSWPPSIDADRPGDRHGGAELPQRQLGVVPGLGRARSPASCPSASRPASRTALFTWALGTSVSWSMAVSAATLDGHREVAVRGVDAGSHPGEGSDDAAHRPARQRVVAGDADASAADRRGCRTAGGWWCPSCRRRARPPGNGIRAGHVR